MHDKVQADILRLIHVTSQEQLADFFTKFLLHNLQLARVCRYTIQPIIASHMDNSSPSQDHKHTTLI